MSADQFLKFAQVLPEPLLLVASNGDIQAINRPATILFNKTGSELTGQCLTELVSESPEQIIDYLRTCSQSRRMILGSLAIRQGSGEAVVCRSQGAVIQPRSPDSPAIVMLRLEKRESNKFVALNQKIHELSRENQQRQRVQSELAQSNETLSNTLIKLQAALNGVQAEKMSGLGQMVAGIAHEINNPISFIHGNLSHAGEYYHDLLDLIYVYQQEYPQPSPAIQNKLDELDFKFLEQDIQKLLNSMRTGSQRVSQIVKSLRSFSRLDEAKFKEVDIHEGLDATLMILQSRLNPENSPLKIEVIKQYCKLPLVYCAPGLLNQVFMSLLNNAIDAVMDSVERRSSEESIKDPGRIWICSEKVTEHHIAVCIKDNGSGIPPQIQHQIFDPFFTTKPIGQGTGLGLSISYQIIKSHSGQIEVKSEPGLGTEFKITLPILSA